MNKTLEKHAIETVTGHTYQFKTGFEGQPEKGLKVIAYAFTNQGSLITSAEVRDGDVKLNLPKDQARHSRIFFAPEIPKDRIRKEITLADMQKFKAYEPVWKFDEKESMYKFLPIPEILWKWWFLCKCRVRGKVVRPVVIGGVTYEKPICNAKVHICEVDKLWWLLPKLPDPIIIRLRDEFLKVIEIPHPIPEPDPAPFKFDPGVIDPSPIEIAKMNRYSFNVKSAKLKKESDHVITPIDSEGGVERGLSQPILSATAKIAFSSSSSSVLRQALQDNFALIKPFICLWPWIWPYFCTCDEIKTVITDKCGKFDTTIWYPCFGDKPDLYFWVEYCIGGVWETVYHPPVCCKTYWNYECGSEVTIRIKDPRVPWCDCENNQQLPGKQVAVVLVGNNVSMTQIKRASAGVKEGLTTTDRPFGGSLEPHVWFGDALIPSGITHYRWSYKRKSAPDVPGSWKAMDQVVIRHYAEVMPDSTLVFKPFVLGPDIAFPGHNVFKIRPINPPLNAPAVSSSWSPEINGRLNTASAFFRSDLLNGGDAIAGAGKYELKLELFKIMGGVPVAINLTDEGVLLKVPTVDGPFADIVPTTQVAHFPAVPGDMEDRVYRNGAGKITGFRLVLHVDNNPCFAEIHEVSVDDPANKAGECGFISYIDKATSQAHISFTARHQNNFATFNFRIDKGSVGLVEQAGGSVGSDPSTIGGYDRQAGSVFVKDVPVADLLGVCVKAAFSETLHVDALATDGWSTLDYLDDDATPKAFALEPAS